MNTRIKKNLETRTQLIEYIVVVVDKCLHHSIKPTSNVMKQKALQFKVRSVWVHALV